MKSGGEGRGERKKGEGGERGRKGRGEGKEGGGERGRKGEGKIGEYKRKWGVGRRVGSGEESGE